MQLSLTFNPVHQRENNKQSQANLDLRREDFNDDCWNVLKKLLNKERLTAKEAIDIGLSGHLARRICDLRVRFGYDSIKMKMVKPEGSKKSHGEYYMEDADIMRISNRIIDLLISN